MPVDLTAVGKKLGAVTHTYTERDVMLYALGVGCGTDDLRFTYERDLQVLPTFAVIPSFPAMLNLGGAMDVNPALVLHGEQRIELHAEIPTSGTITTTPTIKAIYDKVKGAVVVVETESVDQKGRLLFRNTAGIFARGEGDFGGDRGPSGPRNGPPDPPPAPAIALKTPPSDRQSGVEGKRGDLGGGRILKKKKKNTSRSFKTLVILSGVVMKYSSIGTS